MAEGVGYPRLERGKDDRPVWDIGPYGGMAVSCAVIPLPTTWPAHWPEPPLSMERVWELAAEQRQRGADLQQVQRWRNSWGPDDWPDA